MGRIGSLYPVLVVLVFSAQTLSATLKDMLHFEEKMNKPYNMSDKLFDTKEFQGTRRYDGIKEFKTTPLNNLPSFSGPQPNKSFDRAAQMPAGQGQVFTGKTFVGFDKKAYPTEAAKGFTGDYATTAAKGLSQDRNPMGDKTYPGGDKIYQGSELQRRTTEVDIINKTLHNKETLKGETLSMEEVREILNKKQ